jgi:hypothetical protein
MKKEVQVEITVDDVVKFLNESISEWQLKYIRDYAEDRLSFLQNLQKEKENMEKFWLNM